MRMLIRQLPWTNRENSTMARLMVIWKCPGLTDKTYSTLAKLMLICQDPWTKRLCMLEIRINRTPELDLV